MRAVLTGASGNLGQAIQRIAEFHIDEVNRSNWEDLEKLLGLGVDVAIHAAGDLRTSVAQSPLSVMDSNVMTTCRLLEAIRRFRVGRFVFLSSCAVYGESMQTHEESPCYPITDNGIMKLLNERIVSSFCQANGIQYVIVRVFNMYGENDQFSVFHHLRKAVLEGTPFILNNHGIAQRDLVHVRDVAAVVRLVATTKVPYSCINVGTGKATRIADIVSLVREYYPSLIVKERAVSEAEYSRADVVRLRELSDLDFVSVDGYIRSEFVDSIAELLTQIPD
jgi:nucleoside-diphosphate-sugar epimerase